VIIKGKIYNESHCFILRWLSPNGQIENNVGVYYQSFVFEENWAYGWVKALNVDPFEKGRWLLSFLMTISRNCSMLPGLK